MANPLSYFLFQPVLHNWCNKGRSMCCPVGGIVHMKDPLLVIRKNSPCGSSGFPLSLFEWSFTVCLTPYNRKYNVLSASLNKTLPSYLFLFVCLLLFVVCLLFILLHVYIQKGLEIFSIKIWPHLPWYHAF